MLEDPHLLVLGHTRTYDNNGGNYIMYIVHMHTPLHTGTSSRLLQPSVALLGWNLPQLLLPPRHPGTEVSLHCPEHPAEQPSS